MRTLSCALLLSMNLLCATSVHAFAPIEDPNRVLEQLDEYLGKPSFDAAFKCGDQALYQYLVEKCQIGCGPDGCSSLCEQKRQEVTRSAAECDKDQITIASTDGIHRTLTRDEFQGVNGNLLRLVLPGIDEFIGYFGKIRLKQISSVSYTLRAGTPQQTKVTVAEVEGEFFVSGQSRGIQVRFALSKDMPGVGQILRFRIMNETWYRLNDYKKAGVLF